MSQHTANELRAIAELLDAMTKFESDYTHFLTLAGSLNVLGEDGFTKAGQLQISDGVWRYVPATEETKENE
jgi:hypothetical protein